MSNIPRLHLKATGRRYSHLKKALLNDAPPVNSDHTNLTEAALRESEAFYRQMFERNRAVKLVIDPATTQIIRSNQAACDFYGYTLEQLKSLTLFQIVAQPESQVRAGMERIAAEKGATFQTQHRLASGAIRDVEVRAGLLEVNDKRYLYAIIQDITEHKRAEKALRESETLYRLLVQHMPNTGVLMFDTDMRYTLAEGPFLARFDTNPKSVIGKTPQEMLGEDSLNFILPIYKRALEGESFNFERVSEAVAYQAYVTPIRDDAGHIIGGMTLNHDITEIKRAEKALRESEELHRLITQNMPNTSVFIFDHDMRYTLVEGPYIKSFGDLFENMIGKTIQEMLPEDSVHFLLPIYKRALAGESFTFEHVTSVYAYESFAAPVRDDSGKITGGMIMSHDITKRKQAEKALRESEALYRHFTQNMPDSSVVMFDRDMRYTLAEGPFIAHFGENWIKVVGKRPQDILSEEGLKFSLPIFQRALDGESFSYERVTPEFAYKAFVAPVRDDTGQIIGGMFLSHDITEAKRTEAALRETEALYRLFTQHMPNTSVLMFNNQKCFTLIEGDFLKRVGFISENMIGKKPEEAFSGETLDFMRPMYDRVLQGEAFAYDRATSDYAYQAYASPLYDDAGKIIGGMFLSHDVTDAKRTEVALRASEERFHSLVDLAPVGIIETDTTGKRVFCNTRWCEMTGISLEEALGDVEFDTIYPEDLKTAASAWDMMMETHLPFENAIFRYQRPDKSIVWVSGNGRPLYDAEGTITGYIGSVTDITESRSTQEKLRQERDLLRTLIDHMPDYIFLKDAEGRFVLTNTAHAQAGGVTPPSAMIGKTAFDVFPPELARQFHSDDEAIMRSGKSLINAERKTVDAHGNQKTVLTTKIPWHDTNGQILGLIGISHDITERKLLEDALITSESRFRTLIDFAPVGIVETDAHGMIILANAQWSALSGISSETPLIDNGSETIHPDDLAMVQTTHRKMVATISHVDNLEYRFIHPDGKLVWVSDSSRPVFDAEGILTGYIVTMTDITERKLLEDALIASESRFRTLVDFAPVGIVETDAQGMIVLGNARWNALSGISPDRAFTSGIETVHPDDLQRIQTINKQMRETASNVDNLEYRFLHEDGKVVWVSDSSRPLLNPDGVLAGFIMTMTDITEHKRLEEALRQNEERLQNITDNLQDLVLQSDAGGHFVFASKSYYSLLGYEPKSLMGTPALELAHPDDLAGMRQTFQVAFDTGSQQFIVECRLRHADGRYISVEILGKLFFDDASHFTGGIFVGRDISERNRMQNLVVEKEKLQTALDKELELNNLKTRMMNRIAHEFRTPLTVIQATTETLTHYLDRLTPAQRDAKEGVIKGQIQRLTDMLNEIGLVIRTDFTPDKVHRTETDLSALCRQIVTTLEHDLNQPGRFVLDLPEKTEAIVDSQVLNNAFTHVIRNAARFSGPDSPVNIRLSQAGNSITLRVTDTGIGIPSNEHLRIFEPFFRGSNIGESSGLGVGLTTTRAAVEAHGGTISVDSVLGQGTTVTIWIPV